jgi:hypothetical protein
MRVISNTDKI